MINNNIFNHIHNMGNRGSSSLKFYSNFKMPSYDKGNEESLKKDKMDKAQNLCRELDSMKSRHMLKLNNEILNVLNAGVGERGRLDVQKYRDYPLASPAVFGRSPIFKNFVKNHGYCMDTYNNAFNKLCEIDNTKQNILKAAKKEDMIVQKDELINRFNFSEYFSGHKRLNENINSLRVTSKVEVMCYATQKIIRPILNKINVLT